MGEHHCKACLVYCMDFRLHDSLDKFLAEQELVEPGADIIRVAGAIKSIAQPEQSRDRDFLLEMLSVSYDLHGVRPYFCPAYTIASATYGVCPVIIVSVSIEYFIVFTFFLQLFVTIYH